MKRTPDSGLLVAVAWLLLGIGAVVDLSARLQAISALPGLYAYHLDLTGSVVLGAACGASLLEGRRPSWRVLGAVGSTIALVVGRVVTSTAEPSIVLLTPVVVAAPILLTLELVARRRAGASVDRSLARRFAVAWCATAAGFVVAVCSGSGRLGAVIVRPVELSTAGWSIVAVGLVGLVASGLGRRRPSVLRFAVVVGAGAVVAASSTLDAARAAGAFTGSARQAAVVVLVALATAAPGLGERAGRWATAGRATVVRSTRAVSAGAGRSGGAAVPGGARATHVLRHAALRAGGRVVAALTPVRVPRPTLGRRGRLAAGGMALVSVAVVAHGIWWAQRVGWQPTGHSATVLARAYDVGTANHPWGGMATSTGASGGASHPGPLLFDLLAPLVRWLGIQHAAFAGGALLALICWTVAVWAAWRVAGGLVAVVTWVGGAFVLEIAALGAVWEANNVSPTMLAMFATLLASWAAASGVWRAWWWAVALGSLCVQAYMINGVLIVGPVLFSGLVLLAAGRGAADDADGRAARRGLWGGLAIGLVVWIQPLLDVVLHDGGNAQDLTQMAGDLREPYGITGFPKAVAWMCSLPPYWGRITGSFAIGGPASSFLEGPYLIGGLVAVAIAAVWIATWSRASGTERRLRVCVAAVVAAAAFNATQLPNDFVRAFTIGWLVFASVVVWWSVAVTAVYAVRRWAAAHPTRSVARPSRLAPLGLALAAVTVLAAVLSGPDTIEDFKGRPFTTDAMVAPVTDEVLAGLRADGDVLVVPLDSNLSEVATDTVTSNLIVRGIPIRIEGGPDNHYGEHRTVPAAWGGPMLWFTTPIPPIEPEGTKVGSATFPGWTTQHMDAVASRVAAHAREHGPIVLSPAADPVLVRYLAGWYGADTCAVADQIRAGTFPLESMPDTLLLTLYADRAVASPALPRALDHEAQAVVGQAPIEVWEVDRTTTRPIANENLLRNDTACPTP